MMHATDRKRERERERERVHPGTGHHKQPPRNRGGQRCPGRRPQAPRKKERKRERERERDRLSTLRQAFQPLLGLVELWVRRRVCFGAQARPRLLGTEIGHQHEGIYIYIYIICTHTYVDISCIFIVVYIYIYTCMYISTYIFIFICIFVFI